MPRFARHDFADRPPWTRPGVIASAALVVIVVIAAVLLAITVGGDDETDTTGTAPLAILVPDGSTTAQSLPTAVPIAPPAGVRWELVGQTAVPVSATAGPTRVAGGTAANYAHTPDGALIAAAQLMVRSAASAGRDCWEPTVQRQFLPGNDRDQLLAALRDNPDYSSEPGELSQIAGFSYQSYTPDTAVIGLVLRAPSAGTARYHVLTLTLLWRDNDWRMQAPPGGAWISLNRVTNDLTGVVEWGAR
ncbi:MULTISPECIES: hypothetical protein [Micromonospora]|uniref:hypothetical protein n=1 Tax=Micromonospora TaxID=1873 RepID=UPI001B37977E|nr:hypothetical protein [Micromonospora sp. C81]MBQ1040810.1 hypothetical protein [Micromonospora sp. C81]WTI22284.1 hypothetical protein OG886_04050 [Micromonospora zamorensis]